MKKRYLWVILIAVLVGIVVYEITYAVKDHHDPLNKSDAFANRDNGALDWLDISIRHGKVKGELHHWEITEDVGQPPEMKKRKYPVTGVKTKKGYEFEVKTDEEMSTYNAWFSGANLSVQEQGKHNAKVYNAVGKKELGKYKQKMQRDFQTADDQSEQKEKERINKFFTDLNNIYGFLYTSDDKGFQLFIKIDEALREGEVSGTLHMMTDTKDKNQPAKEAKYTLNGITDGLMIEFYTVANGKETKLSGHFHGDATRFDLTFWLADQKLMFHAVTKEEYEKSYKNFKEKVQH